MNHFWFTNLVLVSITFYVRKTNLINLSKDDTEYFDSHEVQIKFVAEFDEFGAHDFWSTKHLALVNGA